MIMVTRCKCGCEMRVIIQPALIPGRAPIVLEECTSPECEYFQITLERGEHERLTPGQLAEYQAVRS